MDNVVKSTRRYPKTHARSFASHSRAVRWSDNNKLTPDKLFLNSHDKYWFKCDVCPHEFLCSLANINKGKWCPYCGTSPKQLCDNDCDVCFNRSFASDSRHGSWSALNELSARQCFLSSGKKYLFDCGVCSHTFSSTLNHIDNGTWCP